MACTILSVTDIPKGIRTECLQNTNKYGCHLCQFLPLLLVNGTAFVVGISSSETRQTQHQLTDALSGFSGPYWSLQVADMDGWGFSLFVSGSNGAMQRTKRICGENEQGHEKVMKWICQAKEDSWWGGAILRGFSEGILTEYRTRLTLSYYCEGNENIWKTWWNCCGISIRW
jgi:hypothetical protein